MKKRVLVIDDEDVVVDITQRKLTQEGYEVVCVKDGEEGLEALRQQVFDLILLDIEMPRMNGYTFISEKNKILSAERAPVIVLTAYDSMEPIFQRHGIRAYLVKPLKFQDLLQKVREVLDDSSLAR